MSFSKITSLSCSSSSLPSLSFSLSLSAFGNIRNPGQRETEREREREKKIFKNNHNKNSHPVNRRERALAGVCLFLWGRGRVDTDADGGGFSLQRHLLRRGWRKKSKVAQRRCFVSAFHAKSLGLEGSLRWGGRGERWDLSIYLSTYLSMISLRQQGGGASLGLCCDFCQATPDQH